MFLECRRGNSRRLRRIATAVKAIKTVAEEQQKVKTETNARHSIRNLMHVHFLRDKQPRQEENKKMAAARRELTNLRLRRLEAKNGAMMSLTAIGDHSSIPSITDARSVLSRPSSGFMNPEGPAQSVDFSTVAWRPHLAEKTPTKESEERSPISSSSSSSVWPLRNPGETERVENGNRKETIIKLSIGNRNDEETERMDIAGLSSETNGEQNAPVQPKATSDQTQPPVPTQTYATPRYVGKRNVPSSKQSES